MLGTVRRARARTRRPSWAKASTWPVIRSRSPSLSVCGVPSEERIDVQRSASPLYAFLDLHLAHRLMYASLTAVIVLGSYLVYTERSPSFGESGPVAILASPTADRNLVGAHPAQDRETVLVALASYKE